MVKPVSFCRLVTNGVVHTTTPFALACCHHQFLNSLDFVCWRTSSHPHSHKAISILPSQTPQPHTRFPSQRTRHVNIVPSCQSHLASWPNELIELNLLSSIHKDDLSNDCLGDNNGMTYNSVAYKSVFLFLFW